MAIKIGDQLPAVELLQLTDNGTTVLDMSTLEGKQVIFALPGAYTSTCTNKHLPGFMAQADALRAKGIETIYCLSVNDPFVMAAWGESVGNQDVVMLADASGAFTKAVDMAFSAPPVGLYDRSKRYAMIVEDGVVQYIEADDPGECSLSSAENILAQL